MSPALPTVLLVGAAASRAELLREAGFAVVCADDARDRREHDAVLLHAKGAHELEALVLRDDLAPAAGDSAVVVLTSVSLLTAEIALLRCGVEAVVAESDGEAALVRALHHAVERKRVERAARTAYATDLATGLPHEAQLVEHMTQLLALRDREPSPMAVIALRVVGFAGASSRLGAEAGNILRRKVAVRLRGALRASDVVASLGRDAFAVLLGTLDDKDDAERVAVKLARGLQQPILVSGQPCTVAAAVGLAVYPDHGSDARGLLQRAVSQAGGLATVDARGVAGGAEAGDLEAANDDTG